MSIHRHQALIRSVVRPDVDTATDGFIRQAVNAQEMGELLRRLGVIYLGTGIWRHGIQQGQERCLLAGRVQLLRHFIRDDASQRPASQQVWALRLPCLKGLHIKAGQFFNGESRGTFIVDAGMFQTVQGLAGIEVTGKRSIAQHLSAGRVHTKEWRLGASRPDGNQRRLARILLRPKQCLGESRHGRFLEQGGQ